MALNPNTFQMSANTTEIQGQLDLMAPGQVISAQVATAQATALVAGQPVRLEDSAGGVPKVLSLSANTQEAFGFVVRNIKDVDRVAGEALEIAQEGATMYMTAGAAIARGADIEVVYTTNKVITAAGTNPIAGYALDKAAADGDLIRVVIRTKLGA